MEISVKADLDRVTRYLNEVQRKQVPFAAAQAINAVAFDVMRGERAMMAKTLSHPRPFTTRGVVVQQKAKKGAPTAIVGLQPEVALYLAPFEFGGLHHLPGKGDALLNPKGIRLDQYGQIRGKPSDIAGRDGVFVGKVKTKAGEVSGFWRRMKNNHLKLLIRFGDAEPVKKRLHFVDHGREIVAANFMKAFGEALTKALRPKKKP